MKLTSILLLTASVICSSWAYPAGGHSPDNDVELINGGGTQPGYQPTPSVPSVPQYPLVPTISTIPLYPSYYPAYPTYTPSYFPIGWTYNIFDGFSNFFNQVRNTASNAWSRVPSVQPMIKNYWPDVKTNGSTTSTVKIVGDHKFIINETVHVQQSDFGHIVFKVRTVDIKPAEPNDETTEGVDNDTTVTPDIGIDIDGTNSPRPTENEEDDERPNIEDTGDIDGRIGTPELLDNTNEITLDNLEQFEHEETTDSTEDKNDIIKQSFTVQKSEKIELNLPSEMISSEENDDKTMSPLIIDEKMNDEWAEVEFENSDEQKNTYYQINNNENSIEKIEDAAVDLSNDIAINQMLADQGAAYNPDAEIFDVSQYQPESDATSQVHKEPQQESIDYLPYPHQTSSDKRSSIK